MIALAPSEVATYYATQVPNLRRRGKRWRGPCPIHRGKHDSFSVDPETGLWRCFSSCGRGGDIIALEQALTDTDVRSAMAEVFRIVGRAESTNGNHLRRDSQRIVTTYDYTDEGGRPLYQVVRMDPKGFRQRQPDGKGGWTWNIKGVRLVLYRLSELLKRNQETVYICEGERDVQTLESAGFLATCNAMGAGKWRVRRAATPS